MGWRDCHLHVFKVGDVRFGEPDDEYSPGPIDYRAITLNQIAPYRGSMCTYEYDFGDSWEHLIEVEDELPVDSVEVRLPHCVGGVRSCPPEDSGGVGGYERLFVALRDPDDEEHEEYRTWVGRGFDPEAFDVERINRRLSRYASRRRRPPGTRPAQR